MSFVAQTDDRKLAIFEYCYTTGGGKHAHSHLQTVISFQSPQLTLPEFSLRPEHMFHRIGEKMGMQDIDFESHPRFSKRYLLQGPDEEAIRRLFTAEVLEFFEAREGASVEASGDHFTFFRANNRVKPQRIRAFMEEGFDVYQILKS